MDINIQKGRSNQNFPRLLDAHIIPPRAVLTTTTKIVIKSDLVSSYQVTRNAMANIPNIITSQKPHLFNNCTEKGEVCES
jgi:hypothetical protein